jgi:hypothetical protein
MRKLEKPFDFADMEDFTLTDALNKYDHDVDAIKDWGLMTDDEMSMNKERLMKLDEHVTDAIQSTKERGEAAMDLKNELIK